MKYSFKLMIIVLIAFVFTACNSKPADQYNAEAKKEVEQKNYSKAVKIYDELAEEHSGSKDASEALLEIAKIYHSHLIDSLDEKTSYKKAFSYYEKIYLEYQSSQEAPNALFMAAFLQGNELNNPEEAKKLYKQFIETYPNSEMVNSAKMELENVGLTPEEILEKNSTEAKK
ncbi:MAG: tetratricopeptide repeat protein [Melioribacteraceae bacterium]